MKKRQTSFFTGIVLNKDKKGKRKNKRPNE